MLIAAACSVNREDEDDNVMQCRDDDEKDRK